MSATRRDDWLLAQLPGGMLDDEFLVGFVSIFEELGQSFLHHIDNLPHVFDPSVTPESMIPVLGQWIGIDFLADELDADQQRTTLREYGKLISARGTERGLRGVLRNLVGDPVVVEDNGAVYWLGPATEPSWGDTPAGLNDHVVVKLPDSREGTDVPYWETEEADEDLLHIVQGEIPATSTFELLRGNRRLWPKKDES